LLISPVHIRFCKKKKKRKKGKKGNNFVKAELLIQPKRLGAQQPLSLSERLPPQHILGKDAVPEGTEEQ
jgi:hypothetical protein